MPDQYLEPIEGDQAEKEAPSREVSNPVEQEILELERKLSEKRAEKQKTAEAATGFEQVKPSSQATTSPISVAGALSPAQVKSDVDKISSYEKDQQIKSLVDLAFQKGVAHASEVVRQLDSPYLMDEFHDILIDEFRKKLVDEGKLEEI